MQYANALDGVADDYQLTAELFAQVLRVYLARNGRVVCTTDGEDRHSKLTLETAKSRLQAPQIRCGRRHSFAATLLSVNMSQRGQRAIDSLASAADHVRTMSVSNSGSCVRKSFRTVLQQIIQRTTTTIVATARR